MIKKGFLLASFAIGVFANIFAQDTLSFKKTRDKNIYVEFLGSSNLIGVSFDSRLLLYPHGDIGLVFLIFKEGILLLKHLTLIEGYFSLSKSTFSPLEISTN